MKKLMIAGLALCLVVAAAAPVVAASAGNIRGDYIETRSADVYTGSCVANSEVNLTGTEAILAWHIKEGSWNGVALNGLGVVGVVKANATLGDPFTSPYPAKSILIVDSRATAEQQAALKAFAQSRAGDLLKDVVKVEAAPIQLEVGGRRSAWVCETGRWLTCANRNPLDAQQGPPLRERRCLLPAADRADACDARVHIERRIHRPRPWGDLEVEWQAKLLCGQFFLPNTGTGNFHEVNWLFLASHNLNNSTNGSFGFRLFLLAENQAPGSCCRRYSRVNSTILWFGTT